MAEDKHEVRIHINRKQYQSPTPTTGHDLYRLGGIGDHQELFREVAGDREDELVPNNDTIIHLHEDEHFYSERDYKIIVNAQQKTVTQRTLSYTDIVALAFPAGVSGNNVLYNITYYDGPRKNPEGELLPNHTVEVKDGMVFHVTPTGQS
jgi:hypothetical protein